MSNCTQCHVLGKKVSSTKCLDCHQEIQSLVNVGRGYHSDYEVTSKECFDCHSDHHGRKFNMVRFEEDEFDHDLTGYILEDQHLAIDCRDCHKPDYIQDIEIRDRMDTYLGLDQECLSCHNDFHQGTLSNDCIQCHNFDKFRPAPGFDHAESDFDLVGQHTSVSCEECHPISTKNGNDFQEFSNLVFNDCISCHEDPHNGKINGTCTQCHTEESFQTFIGDTKFNHKRTGFNLKGSHARTGCYECHERAKNPAFIFQDNQGISESQCNSCHEDIHEQKFGNDCAKCHQESSFRDLKSMDFFNHDITDYPLEGHHVEIDCKSCHPNNYMADIDFQKCRNCHEDYHKGEFLMTNPNSDCLDCHSLNEGFETSLYSIDDHQENNFPLEGAHMATPCFECHISEDRWTFQDIGSDCKDCHADIHEGFISEKYYPDRGCNQCHTPESWNSISFEHSITDWELEGKHKMLECRECHYEQSEEIDTFIQAFNSLSSECVQCHDNVHEDQFEINSVTDCNRCHDSNNWYPNKFDHNSAAFQLDGRHAEIECSACHKPITENGKIIIQYKMESFECIDCHS
jgi:hypothetical protein